MPHAPDLPGGGQDLADLRRPDPHDQGRGARQLPGGGGSLPQQEVSAERVYGGPLGDPVKLCVEVLRWLQVGGSLHTRHPRLQKRTTRRRARGHMVLKGTYVNPRLLLKSGRLMELMEGGRLFSMLSSIQVPWPLRQYGYYHCC